MTTPEISFNIIRDATDSGADFRGLLGSGAAFTTASHGIPTQRTKFQRQEVAVAREHGAVPSRRTAGAGKAPAADTFGMHALDRAIAENFGLEEK